MCTAIDPAEGALSARRPEKKASVYVHFPWCLQKCGYCDFLSVAAPREAIEHVKYADAVVHELHAQWRNACEPL